MSESKELASTSSDTKSDDLQSQVTDPELDIRSEYFNPLKALLSPELHMPIKDAPMYNNIAHYESTMKRQQAAGKSVSLNVFEKGRNYKTNHSKLQQKVKFSQKKLDKLLNCVLLN